MISSLIDRYKSYKKKSLLSQFSGHTKKYAFVGVGNHSISNLYPVIDFFGIHLKYICTRSIESASLMASKYGCKATSDFDQLLNDPEVAGVFISTAPNAHFKLVEKALKAEKAVFVEKPPCLSRNELSTLMQLQGSTKVVVGLQKRHSKVFQTIKSSAKNVSSYNYKYLTGAYPEGDPLWDLFIHPLDVITFLFGKTQSVTRMENKGTLFLQIKHNSGVIGNLELSTDYTWDTASEEISINTPKGIYESKGCFDLSFTPKAPVLMGIPVEKVLKKAPSKHLLVHNNGFVPTMDFNSLALQGYASEIKTFIDLVEGKKVTNYSDLKHLADTFDLIDQIESET